MDSARSNGREKEKEDPYQILVVHAVTFWQVTPNVDKASLFPTHDAFVTKEKRKKKIDGAIDKCKYLKTFNKRRSFIVCIYWQWAFSFFLFLFVMHYAILVRVDYSFHGNHGC